jgi:4-hydroxy-tetrahydrodipicolinate synthase
MTDFQRLPKGVFTAILTPLNDDFSVDYDLLLEHSQFLIQNGTNGITLLGTTGEANSFSIPERKEILIKVITGGVDPSMLMVGTGCCAVPDTVELTRHAVDQGVGAVLMLPPFYYKQVTEDGVVQYFRQVIERVNHPDLRVILYHFPKMSGLGFSVPLIRRLVQLYPGIIIGIKDSTGSLSNMKTIHEEVPHFRVYAGTEKLLKEILEMGGGGCISATANVTIKHIAKLIKLWQSNSDLTAQDQVVKDVRSSFDGLPFTGALKAFMADATGNNNWAYIRPPNQIISKQELSILKKKLSQANF